MNFVDRSVRPDHEVSNRETHERKSSRNSRNNLIRMVAYFERWNGTLVTTMFGRNSSAPLISSDV